jgi:hypothetical protein
MVGGACRVLQFLFLGLALLPPEKPEPTYFLGANLTARVDGSGSVSPSRIIETFSHFQIDYLNLVGNDVCSPNQKSINSGKHMLLPSSHNNTAEIPRHSKPSMSLNLGGGACAACTADYISKASSKFRGPIQVHILTIQAEEANLAWLAETYIFT